VPIDSAGKVSGRELSAEWPGNGLVVSELKAQGWHPTPFSEFIIKLETRCNLACDYCYVFEMADASVRQKPSTVTLEVIKQTAARIGAHIARHDLPGARVVFHGGEPLLAGADFICDAAQILRGALTSGAHLDLHIQTNGTPLTETVLEMLADQEIRVSVSLDGDRAVHDGHRRYRRGAGSYDGVARSLRLLGSEPFRGIFTGLLCVVDIKADPAATYQSLLEFAPPAVDFLLPHGNWTTPPPGRAAALPVTAYGDWLVSVFDHWYGAAGPQPRVRLFEEIIGLLLGRPSRLESIGLAPVDVLVIDTDGSMEQVDTLKSAFDGAAATGLNVFEHDFDLALELPEIAARQIGLAALAEQCRACPVVRVCGGGYYPHRYRAGHGFRQPSVYCPDLLRLIRHIDRRVAPELTGLALSPS
jgi:uncharacterized protein